MAMSSGKLMILVDDAGGFFPLISHSPWDGVTLADFVMPFFLFIVGVALGLTYKKMPDKHVATRKAVLRALKLFILGLVLQGGYFHGINNLTYGVDILGIRWMGILQIAITICVDIQTNECLKRNGGCWQDLRSNVSACKDTYRGRICECPAAHGIQYSGDGYTSCHRTPFFILHSPLSLLFQHHSMKCVDLNSV